MPRSSLCVTPLILLLAACGSSGGGTGSTPASGDPTSPGGGEAPPPGDNGGADGGDPPGDPSGGEEPPPDDGTPPDPRPLTLEEAIRAGSGAQFDVQGPRSGGTMNLAIDPGGTLRFTRSGRPFLGFTPDQRSGPNDGISTYSDAASEASAIISEPGQEVLGNDRLDYTAFGLWVQFSPASEETAPPLVEDAGAFFGGVRTVSSEVPGAGIGVYRGAATAIAWDTTGTYTTLLGSLTAGADFGAGTVNGVVSLNDGTDVPWGVVNTGSMAITGGGFAGSGATSSLGHTGSANGRFFGPNAEEMGGAFTLNGPTRLRGSFGGARSQE